MADVVITEGTDDGGSTADPAVALAAGAAGAVADQAAEDAAGAVDVAEAAGETAEMALDVADAATSAAYNAQDDVAAVRAELAELRLVVEELRPAPAAAEIDTMPVPEKTGAESAADEPAEKDSSDTPAAAKSRSYGHKGWFG